jgi:hypothetical protein
MWEPQPLITLRASKACRGENFTFIIKGTRHKDISHFKQTLLRVIKNIDKFVNKKFWEEPIAYLSSIRHVFKNSSIVACVFVAAVTFFTEPLPSNNSGNIFYRTVA